MRRRVALGLWLVLVVVGGGWAAGAEVGPGMVYTAQRDGAGPWAVFVLQVERARGEYRLVGAVGQDTVFGLEAVAEQARRLPEAVGYPVAAINGDWFDLPAGPYQGDTANLLVRNGELVSDAAGGNCFWVDGQGQLQLGPVTTDLQVTWPDGTRTAVGLNRARKEEASVLYTPVLGASTRTAGGRGWGGAGTGRRGPAWG